MGDVIDLFASTNRKTADGLIDVIRQATAHDPMCGAVEALCHGLSRVGLVADPLVSRELYNLSYLFGLVDDMALDLVSTVSLNVLNGRALDNIDDLEQLNTVLDTNAPVVSVNAVRDDQYHLVPVDAYDARSLLGQYIHRHGPRYGVAEFIVDGLLDAGFILGEFALHEPEVGLGLRLGKRGIYVDVLLDPNFEIKPEAIEIDFGPISP